MGKTSAKDSQIRKNAQRAQLQIRKKKKSAKATYQVDVLHLDGRASWRRLPREAELRRRQRLRRQRGGQVEGQRAWRGETGLPVESFFFFFLKLKNNQMSCHHKIEKRNSKSHSFLNSRKFPTSRPPANRNVWSGVTLAHSPLPTGRAMVRTQTAWRHRSCSSMKSWSLVSGPWTTVTGTWKQKKKGETTGPRSWPHPTTTLFFFCSASVSPARPTGSCSSLPPASCHWATWNRSDVSNY